MKQIVPLVFFASILSGCQAGYFLKSGYGQLGLLTSQVSISEALQDPNISDEDKKKLKLAEEAKAFAESKLNLIKSKNYQKYVQLDRPYVTYVVSAAPKWELHQHQWHYPVVGKMPYKGFFKLQDAEAEEKDLQKMDLDTYLRGVSAYSTLGWFNDPLLSSMLRYSDYDLVNTIIHETVHATLYIKNAADFNERLATFLGNKGAELFFMEKEGPDSRTLQNVRDLNNDHEVFSKFISSEIDSLRSWYQESTTREEAERNQRLLSIQKKFSETILPTLKTEAYKKFSEIKLNNARLLIYKTYMNDLSDFETLFNLSGKNFEEFLAKCKELEKSPDPELTLKELIKRI